MTRHQAQRFQKILRSIGPHGLDSQWRPTAIQRTGGPTSSWIQEADRAWRARCPGLSIAARADWATLCPVTSDAPGPRLQAIRDALLALHKALVDSERIGYEEALGPIPSPNHFLKLLTSDPWFAWLQPLSRLIVNMDAALDGKEPLTAEQANCFVSEARQILVVSEEGDGFARSYFEALQRDPDVIFAHARVVNLIR